jgi:hypothetical protein
VNKTTQELVDRFGIEPEAALRIQGLMCLDFSECTQQEFNDEALRVYEMLANLEMAAPRN